MRDVLWSPFSALKKLLEPEGPHERFRRDLERRGFDATPLGQAWIEASRRALAQPLTAGEGFEERIHVDAKQPRATGYAVAGRLGQVLEVELDILPADSLVVFFDLFQDGVGEDGAPPRPLLSRRSREGRLAMRWEFPGDGVYLLRLQPIPSMSGRFTVRLGMRASLAFPIPGLDGGSVVSVFGDPRDGGRRSHQGVDILAPRGTPVVSTVAGRAWTGENRLGGKVVWVRRGLAGPTLYHAHLDAWAVASGRQVRPGDTLGYVGTTGNARTTPPHLHFGIYGFGKGAVDPLPFLRSTSEPEPPHPEGSRHLGREGITRGSRQVLRSHPGRKSVGEASRLGPGTRFRVLGVRGAWVQVELEDGRTGYLPLQGIAAPG